MNKVWAINTFSSRMDVEDRSNQCPIVDIPSKTKEYKLNLWHDACWCDKIWALRLNWRKGRNGRNAAIKSLASRRAIHTEMCVWSVQCSLSLIIINNHGDQRKSLRVLIAFSILYSVQQIEMIVFSKFVVYLKKKEKNLFFSGNRICGDQSIH